MRKFDYSAFPGALLTPEISKLDIANTCPDISISMIERTLKEMLDKGEIIKVGSGRATAYVKK